MTITTWVALATFVITVGGIGITIVVKLTRMAVAIEMLTADMRTIAGKTESHEGRIIVLETRTGGRHRGGR